MLVEAKDILETLNSYKKDIEVSIKKLESKGGHHSEVDLLFVEEFLQSIKGTIEYIEYNRL